jgi:hypothetical protein
MPENEESWDLWHTAQAQWRAGGLGVIGLDYGCLIQLAQLMNIEWTPGLLRKIQALEAYTLKRIGKVDEK